MGKTEIARPQDALRDYWVGERVGVGARTEVFEAKRKSDGKLFAAKFLAVRESEDLRRIGHLENEYRVLQDLQAAESDGQKYVVAPEEFRKVKQFFKVRAGCLIEEFAPGRSLNEYSDFDIRSILTIFRRVCAGLEHVHKAGYVHADLKPHNILVNGDLGVKLIDFGFAARVGQEVNGYKGTFGFLAPEQAGGRLSEKTDVFNLGAAIYRVLTGESIPAIMPNNGDAGFVPTKYINITPAHRLNPDVPAELSDMVVRCCSAKERKRPTVGQLRKYLHGLQLRMEYGAVKA